MLSLTSMALVWPDELHAHAQMREFVNEMAHCTSINAAFVSGVEDDPDGEGVRRPDLARLARDRLRAWGDDDDAVARAVGLLRWLVHDVVAPGFPHLPHDTPDDFATGSAIARAMKPHVVAARDRWYERHQERAGGAGAEWSELEFLESYAKAAEYVGYLPRRVNVTKYKAKLQWSSRPQSVCEAIASSVGAAFIYAVDVRPEIGRTMHRLGQSDYLDSGIERRAREALYAAGITEFGDGLEQLGIALVRRYDASTIAGHGSAVQASAAVQADLPSGHEAVRLLAESPQLSERPMPASAQTFAAAAEDVLARACLSIAAHLHQQSAGL